MKFLSIIVVLLSLNISANAYFLSPDILDPKPATISVCQSEAIERGTPNRPYINCGTSQSIKIMSALLFPSTQEECPTQYVVPVTAGAGLPLPNCRIPVNNNFTAILIKLCNGDDACSFSFLRDIFNDVQTSGLNCLGSDNILTVNPGLGVLPTIPIRFTQLKVTYFCDGPRKRFRPFSNKRYDPKFSPSLFHTARHPSNNRFVA